jgi:IS5 family transposase
MPDLDLNKERIRETKGHSKFYGKINVKNQKDKIKIKSIKNKLKGNLDLCQVARRKKKWDWAGHVARLKDDRWTYKIMHWYCMGGRRRGRQRARWRDEISKFLMNKNFEGVAIDRVEWQRVREAFAQNMGPVG